jgi:glutathione S-transferase
MLKLVTIPISHYCEKARWALDRAGLLYDEERHVQGIHRLASWRAGGSGTLPVLVSDDQVISDSAEILYWVDEQQPQNRRLFPADPARRRQVEALCRGFDTQLGPAGRRLMYVHVLQVPDLALPYNNQGVSNWQDRAMRHGWPLARFFVSRSLGIRAGVEDGDQALVEEIFASVGDLLADGRRYLVGDRFTAADLTFAALAAAVLAPPEYGVELPQPESMPPAMAELVESFRAQPAGQFALRLYGEERHQVPERVAL